MVHVVGLGIGDRARVQRGGQLGQRGMLEDHACGQIQTRVARSGGQLHGQHTVSAETEEVVVTADVLGAEQFGQQRGQGTLARGARLLPFGRRRPRHHLGVAGHGRRGEVKAAVVVPPAAVPGAVQPRSGARAERVSDQLVAREHGAAEIDVTEDADRDGCQCVIEHVHPVRAGGPVGHDPLLLFGGDDLDVAEPAIGMLGERGDDAVQPAGEPLDRGPVIQFRSIDDVAAVAGCRTVLRIREEVQRQVGLGHVEAGFQRRERRPVVDHLLLRKLFAHMHDHLEQRVA